MECVARAVNSQGHPGLELSSNAVTISSNDGICLPQATGFLGAEPFSAKIKYTGKCVVLHVLNNHVGVLCYMY